MSNRFTNKEKELKMLKKYLNHRNTEMRYYIEVIQRIEFEMKEISNLIFDMEISD